MCSCRDGKQYKNRYKRGIPDQLIGDFSNYDGSSGTEIRFKPDATIFDDIEFTGEVIDHRLREMAFLNSGIKTIFCDERVTDEDGNVEEKVYQYEGGIKSYVEIMNEKKEALFTPPIYLKTKRDHYEVEVVVQYVNDYYDETVVTFANNIRTREEGRTYQDLGRR